MDTVDQYALLALLLYCNPSYGGGKRLGGSSFKASLGKKFRRSHFNQ
jgi:hypothetical protein